MVLPGSGRQSAEVIRTPAGSPRSHRSPACSAQRFARALGGGAWARRVFSIIGTIGPFLMAAPLLGYLIGAGILQSAAFFTPIALHAALGLVVLFLGALTLRPDTGWMALLSGDRPGAAPRVCCCRLSSLARSCSFLFEAGRNAGLYGSEFRLALTLATIALLGTSLLWSAARVDRLHPPDWRRRERCGGSAAATHSPAPIVVHAEDGEVVHLSQLG